MSTNDSSAVNALAQLFSAYPFRIENKWYYNQSLTLDGFAFYRCRFDNCTLSISKGTFTLEECFIYNCQILFGGEALRSVQLFNILTTEAKVKWPALAPQINVDGTLSIK